MVEPLYELEDNGCHCTDDNIESDWEWDEDVEMYVCNGCGDVQ